MRIELNVREGAGNDPRDLRSAKGAVRGTMDVQILEIDEATVVFDSASFHVRHSGKTCGHSSSVSHTKFSLERKKYVPYSKYNRLPAKNRSGICSKLMLKDTLLLPASWDAVRLRTLVKNGVRWGWNELVERWFVWESTCVALRSLIHLKSNTLSCACMGHSAV